MPREPANVMECIYTHVIYSLAYYIFTSMHSYTCSMDDVCCLENLLMFVNSFRFSDRFITGIRFTYLVHDEVQLNKPFEVFNDHTENVGHLQMTSCNISL